MDVQAYIESGILELYVAGLLSESENLEVQQMMDAHEEIKAEVEAIEAAILNLTAEVAGSVDAPEIGNLGDKLESRGRKVNLKPARPLWIRYTGWAAALVVGAGLIWTLNERSELESQLSDLEKERLQLEMEIQSARLKLSEQQQIIEVFRDRNILAVPLEGQGTFASTYAKVYWDKADNTIYLDAEGLPPAPAGKVYQMWSLTLDPLTPTSLGTIDDFNTDENKIFVIENPNSSQAFGITLEPEGGSGAPTLDQLYTLGIVSSP